MTGPRPHPEFEELISASLAGDLADDERRRLDAHLDACDACRGTLASFADGRRIVAGLRHLPVPRDLGARVRTGIESGRFAAVPWYRRPAVLFAGIGGGLAAVAGALLAIVLLGDPAPQVGDATPAPDPTPTISASATPTSSFPARPTPPPAATPLTSPSPSAAPTEPAASPTPTPEPAPASPEPDVYLAMTGPSDNRALTVRHGPTGETIAEIETPSGPPVAAELSPDGQWIAYLTRVGEKGTHEVRVTRIAEGTPSEDPDALPPMDSPIELGETVILGESLSDDPFAEQLFWNTPRGNAVAYTLADPDTGDTDVWLFEPESGEFRQLTDTGNAYAASWLPGDGESSLLWVSTAGIAGDGPVSHVVEASAPEPIDPVDASLGSVDGVFQPLLSPNGRFAIYWNGAMDRIGPEDGSFSGWRFVAGAEPYLAEHLLESEEFGFTSERPLFGDLTVGRDGFTSASIVWGEDSDAYAVWGLRWTGPLQSGTGEEPYPDERRVYFGHATDERRLTRFHAIDRDDIPEDSSVVDVKVSPTGEHLVITAARPVPGDLAAPSADLLLVKRNTGSVADEVFVIRGADDGFWYGPAAFSGE